MREIRYLDKLIDELAKGKAMEKILRKITARASSLAVDRSTVEIDLDDWTREHMALRHRRAGSQGPPSASS